MSELSPGMAIIDLRKRIVALEAAVAEYAKRVETLERLLANATRAKGPREAA
jgi:hypothetical protein